LSDVIAAPPPVDNGAPPPAAPAQTTATNADWRSQLPEDIRSEATLSKFTDIGAFAKSYVNLERMLGAEKIPRPKGDFDPTATEWQMYLDAGGRPKSAAEYKFEEAKLPNGMPYDTNLETKFKDGAHLAGLNNKQASILRDMFVGYSAEVSQAQKTQLENDANLRRDEMMKELGDAYEPLRIASEKAQSAYIPDALAEKIKAAGLHRDPDWIRALGRIGEETLKEDPLKGPLSAEANSPGDYKKAAEEYRAKYTDALYNNMHPEHKLRTDELWRLTQKAFGE
jgi:hypothetical protein